MTLRERKAWVESMCWDTLVNSDTVACMIEEQIAAAVQEEREACAQDAEVGGDNYTIAERIRARGQTDG